MVVMNDRRNKQAPCNEGVRVRRKDERRRKRVEEEHAVSSKVEEAKTSVKPTMNPKIPTDTVAVSVATR